MYRTTLAQQSDCMPYMIASNKMLIDVAKLKPKDVSELKNSKQLWIIKQINTWKYYRLDKND